MRSPSSSRAVLPDSDAPDSRPVVEGGAAKEVSLEDGVATVLDLASGGVRLKDACAQVAEATGLSKKALYDASIAAR